MRDGWREVEAEETRLEAIRRARDVTLQPGLIASVCSPEDLIIYKLISTRQRDHEDAEGVIRRQGEALDDEAVSS